MTLNDTMGEVKNSYIFLKLLQNLNVTPFEITNNNRCYYHNILCISKLYDSHIVGSEHVNYEVMLGAQIYIVLSILTFHTYVSMQRKY